MIAGLSKRSSDLIEAGDILELGYSGDWQIVTVTSVDTGSDLVYFAPSVPDGTFYSKVFNWGKYKEPVADYHLREVSGGIDAGANKYADEPDRRDIDGDVRIIDDIVDMGADETKYQD